MKRSFSPVPKPKSKPQKKRFAARRDKKYRDWARQHPCVAFHREMTEAGYIQLRAFRHSTLAYWHECLGVVQCAHVQSRGAGGPDRGNVVPLCLGAHHEQHSIGTKSFEARWGINLKQEALRLEKEYLQEHGQALGESGPEAEGPAGGNAA